MPFIIADTEGLAADRASLETIAKTLVAACPDMREMARAASREVLSQHALDSLEPDAVYWHRFDITESSPLTFSGWTHREKPTASFTLPQLVMRRFNAGDQDNVDSLQAMSGFYTAGPDAEVFDETNEVRLLPRDVMNAFWALDFKSQYNARMNAFWQDRSDEFRTMAKANFIAKAIEDHQSGTLSVEQFAALMTAIGLDPTQPITLAMLQSETPLGAGVRVAKLDIAGYAASDILRIVEDSGRQFLYVPGEVDAFHVFDTPDELQWWLMEHTNQANNRAQFMSHFALSTHSENDHRVGLHHALDLIFSTWGANAQTVVNRDDRSVSGDPFTYLRDAAKARMEADAEFALYSNSDLRKQMWMGYLRAFGQTFGALAALDWPIALAAVGAGLADVGLNIDQALHGHTTAERKNGVIGAILGSIDVLFNGLLLVPGATPELADTALPAAEPAEPTELAELAEPPIEVPLAPSAPEFRGAVSAPPNPEEQRNLLTSLETNEILDEYPAPPASGRFRNIYRTATGKTCISIGGVGYQVRYVNELNSWTIVDPQNPFSFQRNVPVRLNAAGNWESVSQGLRGGGGRLGKMPRGSSVTPMNAALPTPYDLPEDLREALRNYVESPSNRPFGGIYLVLGEDDPLNEFFAMRERLLSDSNTFYANLQLPERPSLPMIALESPPKTALKQLYGDVSGLVIGESHNGVGSKRLLIDNMALLVRLKVRTLYLEHLMTDLHQADLDLFARTGRMPNTLNRYLKSLDRGHWTDSTGTYTFFNLVKTANEHHMRIRAIDCMTSYRVAGLTDADGRAREKMMNYLAHTVIQADQAVLGDDRWIALVGNAHANTFEDVAGVAELEGVIGLRVKDVAPGEPVGFDADPGEHATDAMGRLAGRVKSDFRLRTAVAGRKNPNTPAEFRLTRAGDFFIEQNGDSPTLIHRSSDGSVVRTPITIEGKRLYILHSSWPNISGRRYASFAQLAAALSLTGMKQVA